MRVRVHDRGGACQTAARGRDPYLRDLTGASTLTSMARATIYTTTLCPYCVQAKRLLDQLAIPYDEIDVSNDGDRRAEMVQKAEGRRTVPQIFIDGEHVGGYAELRALADTGGLAHLR